MFVFKFSVSRIEGYFFFFHQGFPSGLESNSRIRGGRKLGLELIQTGFNQHFDFYGLLNLGLALSFPYDFKDHHCDQIQTALTRVLDELDSNHGGQWAR